MSHKPKDIFFRLAGGSLRWLSPASLQALRPCRIFLPFYHLVADRPPAHISALYKVRTVDEFVRDVDFIRRHFAPASPQQLLDWVLSGEKPDKPVVVFSFDDGLREVGEVAVPILLERGLAPVVFVNSAFVDNRALFFRYKASLLLNALQERKSEGHPLLRNWQRAHGLAADAARKSLLAISYQQQPLLDDLARLLGLSFDAYLAQQRPYLSTDALRALREQGVFIGAHSIDHPLYAQISGAEQWRQTMESMAFVHGLFPDAPRFFSFPFTDAGLPPGLHAQLLSAGPEGPQLLFGCAGMQQGHTAGHYQRVPMEVADWDARRILMSEWAYALAKDWLPGARAPGAGQGLFSHGDSQRATAVRPQKHDTTSTSE